MSIKGHATSRHTSRGARVRSGGGALGNKVKNVRESTREKPRVRAASPGVVSAWGAHLGNHVTGEGGRKMPFKQEKLYSPGFQPCEFGNSKALEGSGSGAKPGGGNRTVYRTGFQSLHGNPVQGVKDYSVDVPATTRGPDIASMYGPERTTKR
jgi:hypothetical protein